VYDYIKLYAAAQSGGCTAFAANVGGALYGVPYGGIICRYSEWEGLKGDIVWY